jgi:hypothetical protein
VINYSVTEADQDKIHLFCKFQGVRVVQGRELELPSGWCLRNTHGGRVVQGRELDLPLGWCLINTQGGRVVQRR